MFLDKINGIYIHIPFCVKKCIYCDFYSVTDLSLEEVFVNSLIKEIQLTGTCKTAENKTKVDTIYFGGGTPSTISVKNICRIIDEVCKTFSVDNNSEITIEVNPGTITIDKLSDYKKTGINRINAGVQSFNDVNLKFLNRIHSAGDAVFFIELARKSGFDNIGIDLIYCLPGQSEEMWIKDLETAVKYNLEHLSCYILTYENGTPLYTIYKKGEIIPSGETISANLFETTMNYLTSKGFHHYEISNFASSVKTRSRHNYKYWDFVSYNGFGPSAHSFDAKNNKRFWNISNLNRYITSLNNNILPVEEHESLSNEQQIMESVFLGLRKISGINIDIFNTQHKTDFNQRFRAKIRKLTSSGIITIVENHCRLTKKGILLADKVASLFVNEIE